MYELTVTVVSGHGTVEPNSGSYSAGTVVTLAATPEPDYLLKRWTGTDNDTSCALTNTVTMDSDKTVTVEFGLPHHFLVVGGEPNFASIQYTIDAAGCGDVIILNAGVYFEDINFNGKDIRVTSTNPDDPYVVAYTIIQGTGTGPVVTFSGSEGQNCVLDGLTITGGNTAGDGGGICGNGTEATIANCIITGNHADGYGGGVSNCSGTIVRCTITGNTAGRGGGGIYVVDCNVSVEDCDINYNAAGDGGGLYCLDSPGVTITRCTISDNNANGSGMDRGGGIFVLNSPILIEDCRISRNSATHSGGGIFVFESLILIEDCRISRNSAMSGGGVYFGGSDMDLYNNPLLHNCMVTLNRAGRDGGGISVNWHAEPVISNCTIADNQVTGAAGVGYGGGLHCSFASYVEVINSIIWGNFAQQGFQVAVCSGDEYIPLPSMLTISYSDVEGGPGGVYVGVGSTLDWGISNIDIDPLFVDAAGDNYHLLPDSPCIDAGDPNYVVEPNETDLDGNHRIVNGTIDMGAYEFHGIQTLYVDADAPFGGDGTSWATAFKYLQDALFNVIPAAEIRVAQGIYKPDQGANVTPGDRTATFELKNGVTLTGGYAGFGEPDPDARDINLYETILTGDLAGNDVDVNDPIDLLNEPTRLDNSCHVLTGSGIDASAILDGLTITAGHALGNKYGGGMYNHDGSPTILNCTFTKNWAEDNGGGMFNSGGSPLLVNCKFTFNATSEDDDDEGGSGIFNGDSSPILVDCVFIGNWADFRGGGIYNSYSNPTLTNCTFSKNRAEMGGAIYNYRDTDEEDYSPTLNNCSFSGNSANDGGAMCNRESSTTLTNCTFSGNWADNNGGGMYNYAYSKPTVTNCIFWGNTDVGGDDESAQICNYTGAIPVINYCCIQGWTGQLGGTGNIDDDPLFVDADGVDNIVGTDDDNLRLLAGSPCIDAGDNSVVTVTTDLDGNPRVANGIVDMGTYEFQGPFKRYYHVDGVNGDNTNDGFTRDTAFETIQYAIDEANDCETVVVWPGVYNETATNGINFKGKAITIKSAADAAVLEVPGFTAVSFVQGEDRNSVFSNFVIRGCSTAIFALFSNPTISNVTIVDNDNGIIADNADPLITNCIFWNNFNGDLFGSPEPIEAKHSWFEGDVDEPNMPTAGLISHWKFDEGAGVIAYDSAGTNHAAVVGATWSMGLFGNALHFDGVDDYVVLGNPTSLQIDSEITISAWIRAGAIPDDAIWAVISSQDDTNRSGASLILDGRENPDGQTSPRRHICFQICDGTTWCTTHVNAVVPTDQWIYVVATRKANEDAIVYYDAVSQPLTSYPWDGTVNYTVDWNIGRYPDRGGRRYFNGTIDEVAIYDRALSAEEIEQMYEPLTNPMFADAAGDDYHLLSERGRYRATTDEWILDDVTSPCIDGGDPGVDPSNERTPNGGRINMGAYGNTPYASMSEWPIKGDVNNDGRFNFMDIAILLDGWLQELDWAE